MIIKIHIVVLQFVVISLTGVAWAQNLTDVGTANPTPGPNDISQLSTNGNTTYPNGVNYFSNNGNPCGESFHTGTSQTNLLSVSVRSGGLNSGGGYGTPASTPYYYLRIYQLSGSPLTNATLVQTITNSNPGFTDGEWLKWSVLTNVLIGNSNYAFTVSILPTGGGWFALGVGGSNPYTGGNICTVPTAGSLLTYDSSGYYDSVFVLAFKSDLPTANTPLIVPKSTVYVGQTVSLTESALGTGTLYYQWRTDGGGGGSLTNIPDATSTNITALTNMGTFKYSVVVTNTYGSATSSVVAVTVLGPASVIVNSTNLMATMPASGLGVCTAVYDNVLISASVAPLLKAAGITAVRYSGGSYADIFNWQNTTVNGGGYVNSSDSFTNFMNTLVNPAGAQAIITVNYGSNPTDTGGGDTNVAAAWVDFANNTKHWGIKYWEIGNEVGGNGYTAGGDWEYDLHYPETNAATRVGQPALSPAAYGTNSVQFISAMKAKDSTIKCGVSINAGTSSYNSAVLGVCGSVTDFVIIHWYPGSDTPSTLAASTQIPATIVSTRTQLTNSTGAAHASQMEIAITETGAGNATGAPVALYTADNFLTWIENGIVNVDYQILHADVLQNNQTPGHAYYGAMMAHLLANVGDIFVTTTSAQGALRVHATKRQDGKTGVMLVNTDPLIAIAATVNITNGATLATSGIWYQFGLTNYIGANDNPSYPVSTNTVSGLGNSFTVLIPAYTIVDLIIPPAPTNTPPVLAAIGSQTVNVGQTVAFTASATDTDTPPQTLTFTLLAGTTNATFNTNSGTFSFRPLVTQANSTNNFTLKVSDNGSPILSATQSFYIAINQLTPAVISNAAFAGGNFTFNISGQVGQDYAVETSTNLTQWSNVFMTNSPTLPFLWTDTNSAAPQRFYRVKLGPPLP